MGHTACTSPSFCIISIILISLSKNVAFVIVVFAGLVVRLAMLKPETIKMVVMRLVPASLLTAIIMLPAVFLGNPRSLIVVTGKVICSVLTLSTECKRGLERFDSCFAGPAFATNIYSYD